MAPIGPLAWERPYAVSMALKSKNKQSLQITNAGDREKREPSHTVGGSVNWCNHHGKQSGESSEN